MREAARSSRVWGIALVLAILCVCENPAHAGWFSALVRDAMEETGGAAGRVGRSVELAPLKSAAEVLDKLKNAPKDALAAHATPEGHWQFVNREGQTFTVGTSDEMKRVLPTLVPDVPASGEKKMTLYLSEDSVFANKAALAELPENADLNVVVDRVAYPLARSGKGADVLLKAQLAPHLTMVLRDQASLEETAFLLGRPLNKANIRTVALEAGAVAPLSWAPKLDPVTKVPLVDQLDPTKLDAGLRPLRGQTALVTGRVDGDKLIVASPSDEELSVSIDRLIAASRDNDVNLIILQSDSSRQAGGRNWLWQTITVGGLDSATEKATFGDFLEALAARRGGFLLNADIDAVGRVRMAAVPDAASAGLSSEASNVIEELISHVTGEVVTNALSVDARDRENQTEHDVRLIPWLPASVQFLYLGAIVCGIAGLAMARKWWAALRNAAGFPTPGEKRRAFERAVSGFVFFLIFLPVVGLPAFAAQAIHQFIQTILAPFRWIRRRFLLRQV